MKYFTLLFFTILSIFQVSKAQTFEEIKTHSFTPLSQSKIALADIDNDNDQDLLMTGLQGSIQVTKLYTNDGNGIFTEVIGVPFSSIGLGSIAFADVDGDMDQDILITGFFSSTPVTKLYTNDGNGNFTEVMGTPFIPVYGGSIVFADIDGDNDQDVLIAGLQQLAPRITTLYQNDGNGNFTEVTGTPFIGVAGSSIAFADVDGDNDQDVLITGIDTSISPTATLYTNNGNGVFTEVTGTPFHAVGISSIAFADIDGDMDQDVLITGGFNGLIAKLYNNDGNGNFTEVTGTPFSGIAYSSVIFTDIDGDMDQDILLTGVDSSIVRIAKLYRNNGNGVFTEIMETPFESIGGNSIAFADIDGDMDQDILMGGGFGPSISRVYSNSGNGIFVDSRKIPFEEVLESSVAFADVDGDNDQDVLITGTNIYGRPISRLYTNNSNSTFTENIGTPFESVKLGSVAFADVDGDNDQDVLITGINKTDNRIAKLYTNDGNGTFTEVLGTPFDTVQFSSIAFADIDGDTDQDLLITGNTGLTRIAKLYSNDGNGNFTEVIGTPFGGVSSSSIAFEDIDGDNDLDLLITGIDSSFSTFTTVAKLYTNDGSGIFTEITGTPFEGVYHSSIAFADVNGDNAQDVLITGRNNSNIRIAKLYTNDGNGNFTEVAGTPFGGIDNGSIAFADVDNDTDQDILITGRNNALLRIAKLYTNDGNGDFVEATGMPFIGIEKGSIAFADIDGDTDQDVLITGGDITMIASVRLYRNSTLSVNTSSQTRMKATLKIFPNPVQEQLTIVDGQGQAVMYNILGQFIQEFSVNKPQFTLDVSQLNKGQYMLFIQQNNGQIKTAKFIK